MRKRLIILISLVLLLVGCGVQVEHRPREPKESKESRAISRFKRVHQSKENGNNYEIIEDIETGVKYLYVHSVYISGLTKL